VIDDRPHAVAWWLWALGLAVVAVKLSNPVPMVALGTVMFCVGYLRQSPAAWGRSLMLFVKIGALVILMRLIFQMLFGERIPGHTLFAIPSVALPSWAAGVSIGGPVTAESLITAGIVGLKLALILLAFGAANAIASPRELLRSLPGVFNEIAVAISVGLCFLPELINAVQRVRSARKLRGRPTKGIAGFRGIVVPVLEEALEHSMELALSMGARGFGRTSSTPSRRRSAFCGVSAILGVVALILGTYGLLSAGSSIPNPGVLCGAGAVFLSLGVVASGRRSVRTRYRPIPFGWRSMVCVVSGWLGLVGISILQSSSPDATSYAPYPLVWPTVSVAALAFVALGLVALAVSPRPALRPSGRSKHMAEATSR
jgi:energy-coupling factor transport system permease protein